ncbi:Tyrosine recombinase XerC [uncultured archaeon]|nr:Tyrosine recombinase XerC [uncultured archaeon]
MINLEEIKLLNEDVYGASRKLDLFFINFEKVSIHPDSRAGIISFLKDFLAKGRTRIRTVKYAFCLKKLALLVPDKNIGGFNKEEITDLVLKIRAEVPKKNSVRDLLITLKKYYKYLKGLDRDFPPEVAWIKVKDEPNILTVDDLITSGEFDKIIECSHKIQDQLLFKLLRETGARISELLTLTIERTVWDSEYECYQLNVFGKTGFRVIPVIENAQLLKSYLEIHEFKDNPKCVLFHPPHKTKALTYSGMKRRLVEVLQKTGITKRIHPHLFRHTDITEKCAELSEQTLKQLYGWRRDSKMLSVYVHLNNGAVTRQLKQFYKNKEERQLAKLIKQQAIA